MLALPYESSCSDECILSVFTYSISNISAEPASVAWLLFIIYIFVYAGLQLKASVLIRTVFIWIDHIKILTVIK
jgi:hypothetical protein